VSIHSSKASLDGPTCRYFFYVFLSYIRQTTTDKVALLINNCAGHDPTTVDPTAQVTVYIFPPKCTFVHQPSDQGIISSFKTLYKTEVVTTIIESYTRHSLIDAREIPASHRGVRGAFLPNVLDAVNLIKICWDMLLKSTIANCWRHSRCLPHLPSEIGSELEQPVQLTDAVTGKCDLFPCIELTTAVKEQLP
jgi:DDE superfamily endonuclease